MSTPFMQLLLLSVGLFALQGLAALPWVLALSQKPWRRPASLCLGIVGGAAAAGAVTAFALDYWSDADALAMLGRIYGAVLHLQLGLDFFIGVLALLLVIWPKGAAVALAAFQESIRHPLFWLLTFVSCMVMLFSVYMPYFTFGEDYKMVKELCYAFTMMAPAFFGVVVACFSVSDEFEGRTAVTLLSKPITRRQFLLGKFVGISLAGALMTLILGWVLVWIFLLKFWNDSITPGQIAHIENLAEPAWIAQLANDILPGNVATDFVRGIILWTVDAVAALPGLTIGYCQVLVLVAVATALATRVPMIVNIPMCVVVYFLGHLTPIMTEVTQQRYKLIHFVAQLFETILPGLDLFDVGSAIVRDLPLDPQLYALYTANVALYAIIYATIAILLGLVMFEDRDVA